MEDDYTLVIELDFFKLLLALNMVLDHFNYKCLLKFTFKLIFLMTESPYTVTSSKETDNIH